MSNTVKKEEFTATSTDSVLGSSQETIQVEINDLYAKIRVLKDTLTGMQGGPPRTEESSGRVAPPVDRSKLYNTNNGHHKRKFDMCFLTIVAGILVRDVLDIICIPPGQDMTGDKIKYVYGDALLSGWAVALSRVKQMMRNPRGLGLTASEVFAKMVSSETARVHLAAYVAFLCIQNEKSTVMSLATQFTLRKTADEENQLLIALMGVMHHEFSNLRVDLVEAHFQNYY
jgi:hypothetical protein